MPLSFQLVEVALGAGIIGFSLMVAGCMVGFTALALNLIFGW